MLAHLSSGYFAAQNQKNFSVPSNVFRLFKNKERNYENFNRFNWTTGQEKKSAREGKQWMIEQ